MINRRRQKPTTRGRDMSAGNRVPSGSPKISRRTFLRKAVGTALVASLVEASRRAVLETLFAPIRTALQGYARDPLWTQVVEEIGRAHV